MHSDNTILTEKANELENLLEKNFIDPSGVVYTFVDAKTMQPWNRENWDDSFDYIKVPGHSPWECLTYENCGMTTGAYLAALSYKYLIDKDPGTMEQALRCWRGIRHIYDIGSSKQEGFFPKIHGGNFSEQTSSDQYLYAMKGMKIFHPLAPKEIQKEIAACCTKMSDFWMDRNYVYPYFTIPDMQWKPGRFPSLHIISHELSGEQKYLDEFNRLNRVLKVYTCPWESAFERIQSSAPFNEYEKKCGNRYLIGCTVELAAMDIMEIDECLQYTDEFKSFWLNSLQIMWEQGTLALTDDGMCHRYFLYDPRTGATSPLTEASMEDCGELGWSFHGWRAELVSSRSVMLARVGMNMQHWLPELNTLPIALKILHNVGIAQMRQFVDPAGNNLLPQHRFLNRSISADSIANWLWAYWEARYRGWI